MALENSDQYDIDVAKALVLLANNEALYIRLLGIFAEDYRGFFDELCLTVAEGDAAKAKQMVHTLKGVAGNLGATKLFDTARDLEILLHEENDVAKFASRMSELKAPLNNALAFVGSVMQAQ